MTQLITKGDQRFSISKAAHDAGISLGESLVGAGWDISRGKDSYDLDLIAAGLDSTGHVPDQDWFIYYGNKHAPGRVVGHSGDNLTGQGKGDDERIRCDFPAIPPSIQRIVFGVNIYRGEQKRQTFGHVDNAFVRIFDKLSGTEYLRYNLTEQFGDVTLVVFGEVYRQGAMWLFRSIGQGETRDQFRQDYGIRTKF